MAEKKVITPDELKLFVPHYPELDREKIQKLKGGKTSGRFQKIHESGRHRAVTVLGTPPIIIAPLANGETYIVDGKHRAVYALHKGMDVLAMRVRTAQEIRFTLPQECFEGLEAERIVDSFSDREQYAQLCRNLGTPTVEQLLESHREWLAGSLNSAVR